MRRTSSVIVNGRRKRKKSCLLSSGIAIEGWGTGFTGILQATGATVTVFLQEMSHANAGQSSRRASMQAPLPGQFDTPPKERHVHRPPARKRGAWSEKHRLPPLIQ